MDEKLLTWICSRCNGEYSLPVQPTGFECPVCRDKGIQHAMCHCTTFADDIAKSLDHRIRGN